MDQTLKKLRDTVVRLSERLPLSHTEPWIRVVEGKLLPRFSPDFPLTVAICGGGSSGKSTLFNSLLGRKVSPTGGKAGMNRRILAAISGKKRGTGDPASVFPYLFGTPAAPLSNPEELLSPGNPRYVTNESIPGNVVLLDTPDFDTGARGVYANREAARKVLEIADILIYLFTNVGYNNRDNTDFIAQILTGIGLRKSFLVYRAYPGFSREEVLEHAMTVARNLYGENADRCVLGIFRVDEENDVASGKKFMDLRPVRPEIPFPQALERIDTGRLRMELHASILQGALEKAEGFRQEAALSLDRLRLYRDSLRAAQSVCIQDALRHFPMERVMKRFSEIWFSTDPAPIRIMRKTGRVIDFPLRVLVSAYRKIREALQSVEGETARQRFSEKVEEDLIGAADRMTAYALGPEICVPLSFTDPKAREMAQTVERIRKTGDLPDSGTPRVEVSGSRGAYILTVEAHNLLSAEREKLRRKNWKEILESLALRKEEIVSIPPELETELRALVEHFRSRMGLREKVRHTFSALLNVLPATAAVTYVLSTGDPVGAVGIKVKLTGLFGLHDLYALIAIPATTGLKRADEKQLEALLGPLARTWFAGKSETVRALFEEEITGGILRAANEVVEEIEGILKEMEGALLECREEIVRP